MMMIVRCEYAGWAGKDALSVWETTACRTAARIVTAIVNEGWKSFVAFDEDKRPGFCGKQGEH